MSPRVLLVAYALLLATGAEAAMEADGVAGSRAIAAASEITAEPVSMCAWFKADAATDNDTIITLHDAGAGSLWSIHARGDQVGDPTHCRSINTVGTAATALASTGYTAGQWHFACCVVRATNSRTASLDGAGDVTNTDTIAPSGIDETNFFENQNTTPFDGTIAEVGFWNVELTDAEVDTLARGFAPPCVRRASLRQYYPMVKDDTTLKDVFSGTSVNATIAGSVVPAAHPRILNCQ